MTWMSHYKAEILKDLGGYIMTDKDTLDRIQTMWYDHNLMSHQDTTWLIKQAEHTQKLWELADQRGNSMTFLSFENKKLREALEFYAGENHYEMWEHNSGNATGNEWTNDVTYDGGETARKVLEELK